MKRVLLFAAASLAILSCSSTDGEPTPLTTAAMSVTCSSPSDEPFTEDLSVAVVAMCNYWQTDGSFHLRLVADVPPEQPNHSTVDILIAGLTGPGRYVTDDTGATNLRLGGPRYNASSSLEGFQGPGDCVFDVLDTNVHELDVSDVASGNGWISLEMSCPHLITGGAEPMQCTVTPSTFQFVVTGCEVSP